MSVLSRLALPLLAGAALTVLAACGPGAGPVVPEAADAEEEASAEAEPEDNDGAHEEGEDGDHDAQDGHDHDDDHAHADEDHDHDHDHAGGSAHVHGVADLALVLEGSSLTAEMISPLANFGLSEAEGVITDEVITSLPTMILLTGGNCTGETPQAEIDRSSGHTDARITFSWTCADPSSLMAASFAGFSTYQGFETVNAIFLDGSTQKAAELKPSAPQFALR
ncbi:MAG: DUF2796 domain-containing protein [Hyphomonas sp.]